MYFTYVLKSLSSNHYYVGQTNSLEKRLCYHNNGKVFWTKHYLPWKVVYFEKFATAKEAVQREKYFKSHAGRNWLKKNVDNLGS